MLSVLYLIDLFICLPIDLVSIYLSSSIFIYLHLSLSIFIYLYLYLTVEFISLTPLVLV